MLIIAAGFLIGLWFGRYYGFSVRNFEIGVIAGLFGSFVSLLMLSVMKALMNRL